MFWHKLRLVKIGGKDSINLQNFTTSTRSPGIYCKNKTLLAKCHPRKHHGHTLYGKKREAAPLVLWATM